MINGTVCSCCSETVHESELTEGPALPSEPGLPGLPVIPYGGEAKE